MKRIALAFVALTILSPVLCLANSAPATPAVIPAGELLQQIFASPAPMAGDVPSPRLMSTLCEPSCDELDGQYCEGKGRCYTGPACVPVGCFCVANQFVCP